MEILKKIDIHVHTAGRTILPTWKKSHFATPEQLRQMYDSLNIEKGVIQTFGMPDCGGPGGGNTNEDIYELVCKHHDTFYWFCSIDPRWGKNNEKTDFVPYLEHYKTLGAKGVGEMKANLPFDDPRVLGLMRDCERCHMPFLFHMGTEQGAYGLIDSFGLPKLEKALAMFPGLTFLAHSQRFWSHISGDITEPELSKYPTGKVAPGGRVVELMRKYPNLCGDLSAGSGANALMRDPEFAYGFMEEFQDRLYFGTDITGFNLDAPMLKLGSFLDEAMLSGNISYSVYEKISRGNALKLLEK